MKRIRQWACIFILMSTGLSAQQVGDWAVDFSLIAPDGNYYSLSQYSGQVVLLFTLGNTCTSCIAGGPYIEAFVQEFAASGHVAALGLDFWDASSSVTTVLSFIQKTGITFPVLLEAGHLAEAYTTTYDRLIVIAPDGSIAFKGNRIAYLDIEEAGDVISALLNSTRAHQSEEVPMDFHLYQNVPNPFNPGTRIRYSLARDGHVTLTVFTLLGQAHDVLVDAFQPQGNYSFLYEPNDLPSGLYFYQLHVDGVTITKKMVLQ